MVTQKNVLILFLLGALLLTGCTAVELLENHTSSAYEGGLAYETGYDSPYSPAYSIKKDINKAYHMYLVADKLGDVRAKEKINSLSKKIPKEQRIIIEEKVKNRSIYRLRKLSHVPYKYDRNRQLR